MKDPNDFESMTIDGNVYTKQQIIDSVNSWVCPVTGFKLKFVEFTKTGKRKPRKIVYMFPSGDIDAVFVKEWVGNSRRPYQFKMRKHLVEDEINNYYFIYSDKIHSLKYLRLGRKGTVPIIVYRMPDGEIKEITEYKWSVQKFRPPNWQMCKQTVIEEIEKDGYFFENFYVENSETRVKYKDKQGKEYTQAVHDWMVGHRVDGNKGLYNENFFKRFPEKADELSTFYYRKFTNKEYKLVFYKIGISLANKTRFRDKDGPYEIEIVYEEKLPLIDAYTLEQKYLKEYREFLFVPEVKLKGHGNSEIFSKDVLNLDKSF